MASSVDEKERMNIEKVFSFSQHLPQMVDLEKIKVRMRSEDDEPIPYLEISAPFQEEPKSTNERRSSF